jgi:hypothetical protein
MTYDERDGGTRSEHRTPPVDDERKVDCPSDLTRRSWG